MKRILVTGANGHLGANIVRALLKAGHEVVAFVRPTADCRGLENLDVTIAYGDVMDLDSLLPAAEGCDVIVHSAAVYSWWAKDDNDIMAPALKGTENIFKTAVAANIKRLVYTSSVIAIGSSTDPNKRQTAADWNDNPHTAYARAKTQSERLAWELSAQHNIPMISLCPSAILGPNDYRPTLTTKMLLGWANGTGQTIDNQLGFVDVRDVAEIHAKAVTAGELGKRYIVSTTEMTQANFGKLVTELTGKKITHINLPNWLAKTLAGVMEFGASLTGKEPLLTRALIDDFSRQYQTFDSSPTWEAFQHTPYDIRDTVQNSLDWLIFINALEPTGTLAASTPTGFS